MQGMKSGTIFCVLALPLISCGADLSAPEILARTAAAYRNLGSYEFHVTVQTVQGAKVAERKLTETGSRPGKYRIEDSGGALRVSDGRAEWALDPKTNRFTRTPLAAETASPIGEFERIDQHVKGAGIAREEQIVVDGVTTPIWVVNVSRDAWPVDAPAGARSTMYRIDKKTFAVHKAITYGSDTTRIVLYSIVNWNRPVAGSLFAFTPPQGAREEPAVEAAPIEARAIVGAEAPDFTLKDAKGRKIALHELRGKVVVLDFWATWCGPCRALMPHLQEMYRDMADKGLVVLGLDVGEDAATVTKFAKEQAYTFPLLLDAEPAVSAQYFVEAYPTTFVIDRAGRIALRDLGGRSAAEDVTAAVKAALDRSSTP